MHARPAGGDGTDYAYIVYPSANGVLQVDLSSITAGAANSAASSPTCDFASPGWLCYRPGAPESASQDSMIDQNSRPARKIGIADHLWETYEDMAQQMGSDRDALINQALFMFARLNGFLEVARSGRSEGVAMAPAASAAPPAAAPPARAAKRLRPCCSP